MKLLLISNSTNAGEAYLKYPIAQIKELEKHVDGEEHMRVAVAKLGIRLDKFIFDESWQVRKAVAENGYRLDVLKDDPHWAVRKAVAKQGYALDTLIGDKDWRVVEAVRACQKAQSFQKEMDAMAEARRKDDGIESVLADAKARCGSSAAKEDRGTEHTIGSF